MRDSRFANLWVPATILTLTAGLVAFGAAYPWGYVPLMMMATILGVLGMLIGRRAVPKMITVSLAAIFLAGTLQLVPMPIAFVEIVSPAAIVINQKLDLATNGATTRLPLSIDPSRTRLGLIFLGALSTLFIGAVRLLDKHAARNLSAGLVGTGVVVAIVGIVQRSVYNGKIYGVWALKQGGEPFGPFINRNHFAGLMLMCLPVALGGFIAFARRGNADARQSLREELIWLSSPDANKALLFAFSLVVMGVALGLTLSRSGLLSLACSLCIPSTAIARRLGTQRRPYLVWLSLVVVAILVMSWVGVNAIQTRFSEIDPYSISERPAIWSDAVRIIRDFWLTGTGLNTFGVSTLFYQRSVPGQHLREAHNDYLQLIAEGGVLVGIPIITTITAFVVTLRRRFHEDAGSSWWIRMGAVTAIIAMGFQSLVEFSLQLPANAAVFTIVCAVAVHDGRLSAPNPLKG